MAVRYKSAVHVDVGDGHGRRIVLDAEIASGVRLSREDIEAAIAEAADAMDRQNYKCCPEAFLEALSEVEPDWDVAMVESWSAAMDEGGPVSVTPAADRNGRRA